MIGYIVGILMGLVGVLAVAWQRSANKNRSLSGKVDALETVSRESEKASTELRRAVDERDEKLKRVDKAHATLKEELKRASKTVSKAASDPKALADLWNKTMEGL